MGPDPVCVRVGFPESTMAVMLCHAGTWIIRQKHCVARAQRTVFVVQLQRVSYCSKDNDSGYIAERGRLCADCALDTDTLTTTKMRG